MAFISSAPVLNSCRGRVAVSQRHRSKWGVNQGFASTTVNVRATQIHRTAYPVRMATDNLAAVPATPDQPKEGRSFAVQVGILFGLWYIFNIIFNIMNKKVLNAWNNPWMLSTVQLAIGASLAIFQWVAGIQKKPNVSPALIKAMALPTIGHLVGHVSTCIAFSFQSVSFSHIVKACEPAFGAIGSAIVLKEIYSLPVYLTLLPIIGGVSLAAVSQLTFSWAGFLFAMTSNLAFASRNIFSKLTMGDFKKDPTLSPQNIYGIMTIMALFIEIPFAVAIEGFNPLPSKDILYLLLGSGVFFTAYQTVSFMALGKTGVVTHAVGNVLKRASVIIVSIIVFSTPVTLMNGVGMVVALMGTLLYSLMKSRFLAKKKAALAQ